MSATGQTGIVGKKDVAFALGWARTTLDRRLATDPKFPVVSRGDQKGGWQFDLVAIRRYLEGKPALVAPAKTAVAKPPAIDLGQLAKEIAPPSIEVPAHAPQKRARSADHHGEASARQRKDTAQADLIEDKVKLARGELVEVEEVRQVLNTMCAALGNRLDGLPEAITKLLNLPDTSVAALRDLVDDVRNGMADDLQSLLKDRDGTTDG